MMLEQSLINPNFLGRDGFRWFIGVVTDIRDCAQSSGGYRVKVRIIGHHPGDEYLKDQDLPWAQVLVPLNMGSGNFGAGCSFNAQGGSTVIGFFLDGDDGQQPIIIGSLFTGANVEHIQEYNKGTAFFNQYKPPAGYIPNPFNIPLDNPQLTSQSSGNTRGSNTKQGEAPPSGVPRQNGNDPTNNGSSAGAEATQNNAPVSIVSECKTGQDTYSKILQALRNFVKVLVTIQNVQSTYIDPVLNKIQDIPALIQDVSTAISDSISLHIKTVRDTLINLIYDKLKQLLDQIKLPKDLEFLKKVAFGEVTDGIWCAIGKVLKRVVGFVTDFLTNMINTVVSMPLCALESAVGSMLQSITNEIVAAISPILDEFASTIGDALGEVSSVVSDVINYAKEIINFLSCEKKECKEQFDYEMNKGFIPKGDINFENIINYSPAEGVSNLLGDAQGSFENWLGISPPPPGSEIVGKVETSPGVFSVDYAVKDANGNVIDVITRTEGGDNLVGNCNVVSLECGLPTVSIFGGEGSGATGDVVVDSIGQIMGVNITNPGSGYVSEPNVYFEDACDNGRGASATAIIGLTDTGDIGVTQIVIKTPGFNYLGPSTAGVGTTASPCDVDPIDENGSSVVGTITGVIIDNTGINYKDTDVIYDAACANDVEIIPVVDDEGRIINVNIINPGTSIRVYPKLEINTENGRGAVLIPILEFNKKEIVSSESVDPNLTTRKVNKVVYCAEDHGN